MIRKFFWIVVLLFGYGYLVADQDGVFVDRAKKVYDSCFDKLKKMDIKIEVNKFSSKGS